MVVVMDEGLRAEACGVATQLRGRGRRVDLVLQAKKMKWVFKQAERFDLSPGNSRHSTVSCNCSAIAAAQLQWDTDLYIALRVGMSRAVCQQCSSHRVLKAVASCL